MSFFVITMMAGFAGSFHCIGMCGGFACGFATLGLDSKRALIVRSLLYNTGRLATYAFIGALAGALGVALIGSMPHETSGMVPASMSGDASMTSHGAMGMVFAGEMGLAQRVLSAAAGVLMLVMAAELLGLRRHVPVSWTRLGGDAFARVFRTLLLSRRPLAALVLGVANGFLPCPLVYAFAAAAASTGSIGMAVLTMVSFGLGTFPAMLFMSSIAGVMTPKVRVWGVRFSGAFVLAVGFVTMVRGLAPDLLHRAAHVMPMT